MLRHNAQPLQDSDQLNRFEFHTRMACAHPTLIVDDANEFQPDAVLCLEQNGGSWVTDEDYLAGAPELILEIAEDTTTYEFNEKRDVYCRIGVKEYIVWTLADKETHWHRLQDGQYLPAHVDNEGIVRSTVFPGLDLHAKALLQGDMSLVLATMQAGIESAAHAEFMKTLGGQ